MTTPGGLHAAAVEAAAIAGRAYRAERLTCARILAQARRQLGMGELVDASGLDHVTVAELLKEADV